MTWKIISSLWNNKLNVHLLFFPFNHRVITNFKTTSKIQTKNIFFWPWCLWNAKPSFTNYTRLSNYELILSKKGSDIFNKMKFSDRFFSYWLNHKETCDLLDICIDQIHAKRSMNVYEARKQLLINIAYVFNILDE